MAEIAFLSYPRLVDTHDNGRIMSLCDRLEREVEIQTGIQFTILRDQKDIKWGDRWDQFIRSGPQSASFLIPVISEPYFRSEQCATEYRQFAQHERTIGRTDLILPL